MLARVQPQYYQLEQSSVEGQLLDCLENENDRRLLYAIFQSSEWKFQNAPIPETLIRQLRHHVETSSGTVYLCPFCAVIEKEANHMTEHIQGHFGLRPYYCSQWYVPNLF